MESGAPDYLNDFIIFLIVVLIVLIIMAAMGRFDSFTTRFTKRFRIKKRGRIYDDKLR
jgi:hypothetical protein